MSAREAIGGRHAALPQLRSSVASGCPGPLIGGYDAHGAALTVACQTPETGERVTFLTP
ncbi:hypothetical protein [Microbispora sp. H10885]|uniref:hypothetical protein n=1 Tax=Microbispora sp. H10885 TaxID=2729110 RepID=UPI0016036632|nr:hypothetical protein [Microbispora sp. H10885]